MITFYPDDHRRESFILGGWNLHDDDVPRPPEVISPMHNRLHAAWRITTPDPRTIRQHR